MRVKLIAVMSLAAVLAVAPQVFALGGDGGGHSISGTVNGGTFNGTCTGNQCSGTFTNPSGGTSSGGTFEGTFTVFAPEPAAMLLVGLGLIGARYIRRR